MLWKRLRTYGGTIGKTGLHSTRKSNGAKNAHSPAALSFAVEVFGWLALRRSLAERLGSFLGAGENRRILAGVLQDRADDLCALAFLHGAKHGRSGGLKGAFVVRGVERLFQPRLRGPEFFKGPAGGDECFFGM